MKTISKILLCVFLSFGCLHLSIAQGASSGEQETTTPQPKYDVNSIGQEVVKQIVVELSKVIEDLSKNETLKAAGESILAMLFALVIAWGLIKAMMGNGFSQFIEEMIVIFLYWGIIYGFINAGGIEAISSFIDSIASAFVGQDMSKLSGALENSVNTGFAAIADIISMPSTTTNFSLMDFSNWIPMAINAIVQLIAKIATGIIVALALVTYMANIVVAFASIALAIALAPVMIPFLIVPGTSFIFDGWLRFFITSCLMKVVGAFIMMITAKMMAKMVDVASNINLPTNSDMFQLVSANFIIYISIILIAMICASMMVMVPALANGLVSGSASSAGFGGLSKVLGGSGMSALNRVATPAAGKAGKSAAEAAKTGSKAAGSSAKKLMKLMQKK